MTSHKQRNGRNIVPTSSSFLPLLATKKAKQRSHWNSGFGSITDGSGDLLDLPTRTSIMKTTLMSTCWATVLLAIPQTLLALDLKTATYKGCFSSADGFEDQGSYTYQSPGYCQEQCVAINKPVMALAGGSNCWCGDLLPVASNKVSDSDCSTDCQGYPDDKCMSLRFTHC